jgi:hypothetical protein
MHQREQFVAHQRRRVYSMTELCARCGVSRKTGYKPRVSTSLTRLARASCHVVLFLKLPRFSAVTGFFAAPDE